MWIGRVRVLADAGMNCNLPVQIPGRDLLRRVKEVIERVGRESLVEIEREDEGMMTAARSPRDRQKLVVAG